MTLRETLEQHWPPQNVVMTCGECGAELHNVLKSGNPRVQPPELSAVLDIRAKKHRDETGHDDAQVDIRIKPQKLEKIDMKVTVSEQ